MKSKRECPQCRRLGYTHEELKDKVANDLYFACSFFMGDRMGPDFHKPVIWWYDKRIGEGCNKICIMIPRGAFKTTMFTVIRTIQKILKNPNVQILICMNNSSLAEMKLVVIKEIMTSDWFSHLFPDVVPDKPKVWTKSKIIVNRPNICSDPTVLACGTETAKTGYHFDSIILDDPIDGEGKDVNIQSARAEDFLKSLNGLWVDKENKDLLVLGTMWPCRYYSRLVNSSESRFNSARGAVLTLGSRVDERYLRLLDELGLKTKKKIGDPLLLSEEALMECKADMQIHYAPQMENIEVSMEGKLFSRDNFRFFEWVDSTERAVSLDGVGYPLSSMRVQLVADSASGKHATGDESAIVVIATQRKLGISFLLYAWSGLIRIDDFPAKIFGVADRFNVNVIRPEEIVDGGFVALLRNFNESRRMTGERVISIDPVTPQNSSKASRVATLQPYFSPEYYSIWLAPSGMDAFIDEADGVAITSGALNFNPNMLDAAAYAKSTIALRRPVIKQQKIRVEDDLDEDAMRRYMPNINLTCDTRSYVYSGTR